MAVISAKLIAKTDMLVTDGKIIAAGEYEAYQIPERPNVNAPNGRQPASWILIVGSDKIDVTGLVHSGDLAVLNPSG